MRPEILESNMDKKQMEILKSESEDWELKISRLINSKNNFKILKNFENFGHFHISDDK